MTENGDGLAARIRHRLRFVESFHDRKLFVEVLAVLESPDFVPKIPHPDGSGDPLNGRGPSEISEIEASVVIDWLERKGVRQLPWQLQRLGRL